MNQFITIHSQALTVTISNHGAELQSIRDAAGEERLWEANPAFWAKHAPILFPVAGGFREDRYELDGVSYPMKKHGFARDLDWEVESVTEEQAIFLLRQSQPGFPFAYELRACYTVHEQELQVSYSVKNLDMRRFYFSIGSHEAYATPGGIEEYEIVFDEPEHLMLSELIGNLIPREEKCLGDLQVLPLQEKYFAVDAMVFRSVRSRGVTLRRKDGARPIHVAYPDCSVLMLWTKPGAPYLCIEPWCNAPDFVDASPDIAQKPGFIGLMPGEQKTITHVITF